ncbi:H-NS family nucleoid-associated regulatory protein [Aeromonas veronii]
MNEFELVKAKLTNRRSFSAFLKTVDLPWLIDLQSRIDEAIKELEVEAQKFAKEEEERNAQIADLLSLIESSGLNLNDLIAHQSQSIPTQKQSHTQRRKAEPKYQFTGSDGNPVTWTGRGRMPVELAAMLKDGKTLDDFLIKKTQE